MADDSDKCHTGKHVLELNRGVSEGNSEVDCIGILKVLRPGWKVTDIKLQPLTEGHLNKMYVASLTSAPEESSVIIRVPAVANSAIFDREKERTVVRLLNELGLSSLLLAEFKNGVCLEYLQGENFTRDLAGADIVYNKKKEISWAVAREMARYHSSRTKEQAIAHNIPVEPKQFQLFRALLDQLPERSDFQSPAARDRYLTDVPGHDVFAAEVEFLEGMVEQMDCEVVFSHGDLVISNVIYDEKKDKVKFIDYEFAGFNYRPVDLASFFYGSAGLVTDPESYFVVEWFKRHFINEYLQELWKIDGKEGNPTEDDVTKLNIQCDKYMLVIGMQYSLFPAVLSKGATAAHKQNFDYIGLTIGRYQHYKRLKDQLFGNFY